MALQREWREPDVQIVRIDRPDRRGALDSATLGELLRALDELAATARVLVLSTTDPRAFCAGADVAEPLDRAGGVARMESFAALYAALEAFPAPVVCVCVGNVVGAGAEIAAASDLRVAGDNLRLAWAGARLGVPVGPARLAPLVGLAAAKELVLTGRTVGAEEARALGFVHRVVPAAEAEAAALALAEDVAAHPPAGTRRLKALFRELDGTLAQRVARENEVLVAWQRDGAGLPHAPRAPAGAPDPRSGASQARADAPR